MSEQAIQAKLEHRCHRFCHGQPGRTCPRGMKTSRQDVAKIDVPTLVVHGDSDRIVPFSAAGSRTAKLINGAELVVIKDGPAQHRLDIRGGGQRELLKFLAKPGAKGRTTSAGRKAVA